MTTPRHALPLLETNQASKEVTHNQALLDIDTLMNCAVEDKDLTTPPGTRIDGAVYIVAASATGAWDNHDGELALDYEGTWYFYAPFEGLEVWVKDENKSYTYTGSAWSNSASFDATSPMTTLGDMIYGGTAGTGTRLAGNAASSNKFLRSTGSAGLATAPSWQSIVGADISNATAVGLALLLLTNPGAVTFPRFNADNTVTARSAADFRADIGAVGLTGNETIAGDKTFSGTTVFSGSVTFNGTTTTVNSTTVTYDDSMLKLADGNAVDTLDLGWYGQYQPAATPLYAGLFRDASDSGKFKLYSGLEVEPTTTVDTGGTGYTAGTLVLGTLHTGAGSVGAPSVHFGDATTGFYRSAANEIGWTVSGALAGVFTANGRLVIGNSTSVSVGNTTPFQVHNSGVSGISAARYSVTTTACPEFNLAASRTATIGALAATASGDRLGTIKFFGVDTGNTSFRNAVELRALQAAAGGATYVPGHLDLIVTDSGGSPVTPVRFGSGGSVRTVFGSTTDNGSNTVQVNGTFYASGEVEIDGALNHDGSTVGFYGVTPTARPAAYNQAGYSTTTRTVNALTSSTLTDNTGGTANTTLAALVGTYVTDVTTIRDNFADLAAAFNALYADVVNIKQVQAQNIDDHQSNGLFQ